VERIQRALEISRLQRAALTEVPVPIGPSAGAVDPQPVQTLPIDREALRARRVVLPHETGPAARAYRMLRAQVLQRARASRMRVFGIASAASGEGKTLTAINLALGLAAEPNQTISLVDLDLRRPSVAATLGIAPTRGLESWLFENHSASSALCQLEGVPRLSIAATLGPVTGSSEALAGHRTRELLDELKAGDSNGIVIVDLPAALLGDDVLTVSPLIDGFILVVSEGHTRREDVERMLDLLGRNRIVGTVLNASLDSEQRTY
jgi:protein-tyrosine kinase